jgi:hypothetical protein
MSRYLRYLRIAFSATSVVACVLLVVLWVRSYYYLDELSQPISWTHWIGASSIKGQLHFYTGTINPAVPFDPKDWGLESVSSRSGYARSEVQDIAWDFYFDLSGFANLSAPHWFLALLSACLAAAPWIKWSKRFSLRTLLIAATLIAVLFGLAVATS